MAVVLLILGLMSAGVTVDFLVENHVARAQAHSFMLFGSTVQLSDPALVLLGFALGVLTILFLGLALRLRRRHGSRRRMGRRVRELERENDQLRSKPGESPDESPRQRNG